MSKLIINTDGGSRGNPGPAAIGVVIKATSSDGKVVNNELSECIGVATNNVAEYMAVLKALEWCKENNFKNSEIEFNLDSMLVVEQLNQRFKLKNEGLKPLFWQIREHILELGGRVSFAHIPREKNKEADALVNMALDKEGEKNV